MHNSTPHSTTGFVPSSLMFGRILKDKTPGLLVKNRQIIEEVYDDDHVKKVKGVEYADKRRIAQYNEIAIGNTVVARRIQKENKFSTLFHPEIYSVIERRGPEAVIQSKDSNRIIHRNVRH